MAKESSDDCCYSPVVKKCRLSSRIHETEDGDLDPFLDLNDKYSVGSLNNPLVMTFEVSRNSAQNGDVDINGGDSGFQDFNESQKLSSGEEESSEAEEGPTADEGIVSQRLEDGADLDEADSAAKEGDVGDNLSDDGSDISNLSCVSCLSNMSGEKWKPISGPLTWVQQQITCGTNPRDILQEIVPDASSIPPHVENLTLWRLILSILSEPPRRQKLPHVNTLDDVIHLIKTCKKIIVLTGAGISVSCGIPDFRSLDGIYARLSKDFPDLPDPQAMFDIHYFRRDQRPFFKFAREIYPGLFKPSLTHKFIKLLEKNGKLLRNYSQNIDTLEKLAGIENVITCHGSFATATCTRCKHKVDSSLIKDDIFSQKIPRCPVCPAETTEMAVMKPDIVFFGEGLSDEFHEAMTIDKDNCDLLIVIGSSLKVRPVALIPSSIPSSVPQILINREKLPHFTFDVELLGDCDTIVKQICNRLVKENNLHNLDVVSL